MGPRHHLSFCKCKAAWLAQEFLVSKGSSPHLWFRAFKTATLGPKLLVSMGPSPHLWFLQAKQRPLVKTNRSLWVPALTCGFWMQNSDFLTRTTSLYGSQPSPVVLHRQISTISTRNTCLYWSQHSSVVFACKTATFGAELQVSIGPRPHLSFCACKPALLA